MRYFTDLLRNDAMLKNYESPRTDPNGGDATHNAKEASPQVDLRLTIVGTIVRRGRRRQTARSTTRASITARRSTRDPRARPTTPRKIDVSRTQLAKTTRSHHVVSDYTPHIFLSLRSPSTSTTILPAPRTTWRDLPVSPKSTRVSLSESRQ